MIKVEMLKSPDINRKGVYRFFFNEIKIGHSIDFDFVFDPVENNSHPIKLLLERDESIYIYPIENDTILVNGNKTNSKKKIFPDDIIEYRDNRFKILETKYEEKPDLDQFMNQQFEKMKIEKSPFLKVLKMVKD